MANVLRIELIRFCRKEQSVVLSNYASRCTLCSQQRRKVVQQTIELWLSRWADSVIHTEMIDFVIGRVRRSALKLYRGNQTGGRWKRLRMSKRVSVGGYGAE